uniref:peptidylprolyl isomerase n=1 Tax=Physcomitrium patens TaxID=3218 RepID=A0A7I4ELL7_PHYPA|nr:peptidyl-prolyl cis-trans isomerase CYP38, chloroplastic-like isoform X1 [Physcomitrium patens]|eukprot:XP_024385266.1 peptidyl-prolyl cis-trans isomerase CYP38, chloroplastic-like isoform X1 [Physcomitrella patens]
MVVSTVLQAAQGSLATASTSRLGSAGFHKEGLFGAQCRHRSIGVVGTRRSLSIRASSDMNSKDHEVSPNVLTKILQTCATCVAVTAALLTPLSATASDVAFQRGPAISELSVLISGPPIKDANALLRYALPIQNKPIKEVQKSLEEITEEMKVPGEKALGPVERSVRQAARVFNQNKAQILADIAPAKKQEAEQLLSSLEDGLQDYQKQLETKDRSTVFPKQKELLRLVGNIEEAMVSKFPFEIPEEFANRPLLKGRATLEMKVNVKDNPNVKDAVLQIVVDGYNAPVTAGNFVDLVQRKFYDGMEIQRGVWSLYRSMSSLTVISGLCGPCNIYQLSWSVSADGFVVQTGDPEGPADGFVDPATGKVRTVPLEIMVDGEKEPIYGATLEELGKYKATTTLPFNAFGTMAMAREEFDNDSGSSQVFWLLKESELTPSSANILDGRYTVFGYVTENEELLADFKVGDVIESIRVVNGLENLVNPSY